MGVKQDKQKGFRLTLYQPLILFMFLEMLAFLQFQKAAEKHDLESLYLLARCYLSGIGTKQDLDLAIKM